MILSAKIMIIFDSAKKNRIYFHKAYVKSRTGLLPLSVTRKTISLGGLRTGGQSRVTFVLYHGSIKIATIHCRNCVSSWF